MDKMIRNLVNEVVQIKLSGKNMVTGTLVDVGQDTIVLYNGKDFMYISLNHIQSFELDPENEEDIQAPMEFPSFIKEDNKKSLMIVDVIKQSTGKFVEIYVTGDQPLFGHITSVINDYFVFESAVNKTMYISLEHLKWLIPYSKAKQPFDTNNYDLTKQPNKQSLANTFEAQIEKYKNQLVVFNISGNKSHLGRINNLEKQVIEIQTIKTEPIYLNLKHIKTMHLV